MSDVDQLNRLATVLHARLEALVVTPSETALESLLMQALTETGLELRDTGKEER